MATAFNIGDMAVYPAQGVTEILGIEALEISGFSNKFYVLRCLDSEKKIRVPVNKVDQVGLRRLVDEEGMAAVREVLQAPEIAIEEPNWNRRYRRYVEKMQTGILVEVAQVLRDLHLTKVDKVLSYGEKRVYEMAMQLLVQEISVAKGEGHDDVAAEIEALLG